MDLICNDIARSFILTAKLIIFLETTPLFQFFVFSFGNTSIKRNAVPTVLPKRLIRISGYTHHIVLQNLHKRVCPPLCTFECKGKE